MFTVVPVAVSERADQFGFFVENHEGVEKQDQRQPIQKQGRRSEEKDFGQDYPEQTEIHRVADILVKAPDNQHLGRIEGRRRPSAFENELLDTCQRDPGTEHK
jgi:hypothetical protein